MTSDRLKAMYGPEFDPTLYNDENHQFTDTADGTSYFFLPQDWNYSDLSDPDGIRRVYPGASPDDPADTTEDGYLRYYEYEYVIDNLQPSVPYNFSVTAFDYGALRSACRRWNHRACSTPSASIRCPRRRRSSMRALRSWSIPIRIAATAGMRASGMKTGTAPRRPNGRARFISPILPRVCTIRIFTLSGDLVQEIKHDRPDGGGGSQHEVWNLISRNTQAVTSGIYLWQVSSESGDQLGKLVIIK